MSERYLDRVLNVKYHLKYKFNQLGHDVFMKSGEHILSMT